MNESEANNARKSKMADVAAKATGTPGSTALVLNALDWTTCLQALPNINMKDVKSFVSSENSPKSGLTKAYKFFGEGFVDEFQGQRNLTLP